MPTIESIEEFAAMHAKRFEQLAIANDPMFDRLVKAIDIVKQFIRDRGCIIYGGSAMDYAFRTRGGKIYPDESLAVPDLDFFARGGPNDAYLLANRLYEEGFIDTRVIKAFHVHTMRIDCGAFHWIADVSYVPGAIFDIIPTLVYDGMLCVHPTFQRMDLHMSLSRPYFKAPQEAVFERWKKDIDRFRILDSLFGLEMPIISAVADITGVEKLLTSLPPQNGNNYVMTGYLAAILHLWNKNGPPATLQHMHDVELLSPTAPNIATAVGADTLVAYSRVTNILPARVEGWKDGKKWIVYSNKYYTVGVSTVLVGDKKYQITDCQSTLHMLLGRYILQKDDPSYLAAYVTLLNAAKEPSMRPNLSLQLEVFGDRNITLSNIVETARVESELYARPMIPLPDHYRPNRSAKLPQFDPLSSIIYHEAGDEIPIDKFAE
jgi:hypothetical protein